MPSPNPYEEAGRQKKALKLFHAAVANQINSDILKEWANREEFWTELSARAGVSMPHDETRKLVAEMMKDHEIARGIVR